MAPTPRSGGAETRVGQCTEAMVPFDGLHEKQQGQRQHGPVVQTPDGEQHHAHEAEQQQHIPRGKKGGVERGEPHQQQQPPEKAASEVFAAALPGGVLQMKGEAEKQREDRIGLACEKREHDRKDTFVEGREPRRRRSRINRKDKMFEAVYEQDRHHGKAAQSIHRVDTGFFCFKHNDRYFVFFGVKVAFNRQPGQ